MHHVGIIFDAFLDGLIRFEEVQTFHSMFVLFSWSMDKLDSGCAIKINILINKAMAPHVGLTVLKIDSARICFGFKYPGSKLGFF